MWFPVCEKWRKPNLLRYSLLFNLKWKVLALLPGSKWIYRSRLLSLHLQGEQQKPSFKSDVIRLSLGELSLQELQEISFSSEGKGDARSGVGEHVFGWNQPPLQRLLREQCWPLHRNPDLAPAFGSLKVPWQGLTLQHRAGDASWAVRGSARCCSSARGEGSPKAASLCCCYRQLWQPVIYLVRGERGSCIILAVGSEPSALPISQG